MKTIFVSVLGLLLNSVIAEEFAFPQESRKIEGVLEEKVDKSVYAYVGVGGSAFVFIPYGANISIGARVAKEKQLLGLDISGNYTITMVSQYIFGKVLAPFYFFEDAKNSYFLGPFVTLGFENTIDPIIKVKGNSLLAITGLSFGENTTTGNKLSFWQVGANMRRLNLSHKEESVIWPTMTFQYGIGF
jgi:hypothetical protein